MLLRFGSHFWADKRGDVEGVEIDSKTMRPVSEGIALRILKSLAKD